MRGGAGGWERGVARGWVRGVASMARVLHPRSGKAIGSSGDHCNVQMKIRQVLGEDSTTCIIL